MTIEFSERKKTKLSTMSYILRACGILPLLAILASFCPAHAAQLQVNANAPYACAAVQGALPPTGRR
jgi:hypothetical protein